jgi:hypothetical protein
MSVRRGRGRPSFIWRSELGMKFVEAVALTKYRSLRPISTPAAIRMVLEQPDFAELRKYNAHYLKKQLLDAADYWGTTAAFRELIGRGSRIYWLRQNQKKLLEQMKSKNKLFQ